MISFALQFSQFDTRWNAILLGNNIDKQYTINDYGCLLCVLAMILCYYGFDTDPARLNTLLINLGDTGGFQKNNGVYRWGSLAHILAGITETVVKTPNPLTDGQMAEIKTALDNRFPVILQLDYNPKTVAIDQHFVAAVAYNPNNENDITIVDPLGAKTHSLKDYLGWFRPSARNTIQSYVIMSGTIPEQVGQTIPVGADVFPNIVHGSDQWDQAVTEYLPGSDPKHTEFPALKTVIDTLKKELTDLKTKENQTTNIIASDQAEEPVTVETVTAAQKAFPTFLSLWKLLTQKKP